MDYLEEQEILSDAKKLERNYGSKNEVDKMSNLTLRMSDDI